MTNHEIMVDELAKEPLKEVAKLIHNLNTLNYLRNKSLIQPLT